MKTLNRIRYWTLSGFLLLAACAPDKGSQKVAGPVLDEVGCPSFENVLWERLYEVAEETESLPSAEDLEHALLVEGRLRGLDGARLSELAQRLREFHAELIRGLKLTGELKTREDWLQGLAEAELGDRSTDEKMVFQMALRGRWAAVQEAADRLQIPCTEPVEPTQPETQPAPEGDYFTRLKSNLSPAHFGAKKTMAVAYQTCAALELEPVSNQTPSVKGIKVVGRHRGGGLRRKITSKTQVANTHYYIRDLVQPQKSCFSVRANPLIYDFGGKPFASTKQKEWLNLFVNSGSGGPSLGIDCSAFVVTALTTAGMKLSRHRPLRNVQVYGVSAAMLKEPQRNGLNCLKKVVPSDPQFLQPGDIVASKGHAFMIDDVGEDPFGISRVTSASGCQSLTTRNFDFVIVQSSPIKGGIGINRIHARDYLSGSIGNGMLAYAKAACRAKFGAKARIPSTSISITRHLGTPNCLGRPLRLTKEDCLSVCQ